MESGKKRRISKIHLKFTHCRVLVLQYHYRTMDLLLNFTKMFTIEGEIKECHNIFILFFHSINVAL